MTVDVSRNALEQKELKRLARRAERLRWALEHSGAGAAAQPVLRVLSVLEIATWASLRVLQDPRGAEPQYVEGWLGSKARAKELRALGIDVASLEGAVAGIPRLRVAPGARLDGPAFALWVGELQKSKPLSMTISTIAATLGELESGNLTKAMELVGWTWTEIKALPEPAKSGAIAEYVCGCSALSDKDLVLIKPGLRHRHGWMPRYVTILDQSVRAAERPTLATTAMDGSPGQIPSDSRNRRIGARRGTGIRKEGPADER